MGPGRVRRPGFTARQVLLLVLLAGALAGLLLLLEYIVSVMPTGPHDLLAGTSSEDETLGVANGVELLKYLILAVAIAVAVAALVPPLGWMLRGAALRRWRALLASLLAAAAIVLAGAYLAFSGMLDDLVPYDEHLVRLTHVESRSLVLLAAIFISVTMAGLDQLEAAGTWPWLSGWPRSADSACWTRSRLTVCGCFRPGNSTTFPATSARK